MRTHTLMQAIARANRVYPGKTEGVIVDYNGMLKSLREALSLYALGDDDQPGGGGGGIVTPIEEYLEAFLEALEASENHLKGLGFEPARLTGAKGFKRTEALRDAVDALYTSDEAKRRFEIIAREVFSRFKALLMEPSALRYAVRHDDIETTYKKLQERRDTADVTEVLKELHKIVNEAIRAQEPGDDQMDSKDTISKADREKLKLASRSLLSALRVHIQPMPNWTKNTLTQADVKMFILDNLYTSLPRPPFSDAETDSLASRVYDFVWQRSAAGAMFVGTT